jgi:PQQ-like domain
MRRLIALVTAVASLALAAPAGAQLASTSSWPQVGHDPGLTRRALVTGSQTGTPATGFPAPLFGGSLQLSQGNTQAGPPAVYVDGNLIAGTNATNNTGVAQLDYVNAADVTPPGAVRALFTAPAPWPSTVGFSDSTPAVDASGVMYAGASDGNLWGVPPSGSATPVFSGPPGTTGVSGPTLGANDVLYFSAITSTGEPGVGAGATIYAVAASSGQVLWSYPVQSVPSSIALDTAGNAYTVVRGALVSINALGGTRWSFDPPGPPGLLGSPMVYGSTAFVLGGAGNTVRLYAVNTARGQQIWATPLRGNNAGANPAPALGPSGNVMAATNLALTAVNRTSGKPAWAFPMPPNTFVDQPPLVDGSGDTYVFAGLQDGGGTVIGIGATGQQLWENNIGTTSASIFGTFALGTPTGATIGLDGTIYVSATDGKIYAFTDPS